MSTTHRGRRDLRHEYREQVETGQTVKLPKKKLYRQRAHANPFSDHQLDYPVSPEHMDWSVHFPAFVDPDPNQKNLTGARKLVKDVELVDIGCGFGGLLVALAPLMPDTLMIGMEIRLQVLEYVQARVQALRNQRPVPSAPEQSNPNSPSPAQTPMTQGPSISTTSTPLSPSASASTAAVVPGAYQNISGIRANTMKFLPNFFRRHQLHSIFICFPDPHFKTRKHKARIVSETLNAEYAYVLRPGGKVYTITDVEELHRWMVRHFEAGDEEEEEEDEGGGAKTAIREMWERLTEEELAADPCVKVMMEETEEGKKVTKNNGPKFVAVWRRKEDPPWPLAASVSLDMS